jgi:hypothetical protein
MRVISSDNGCASGLNTTRTRREAALTETSSAGRAVHAVHGHHGLEAPHVARRQLARDRGELVGLVDMGERFAAGGRHAASTGRYDDRTMVASGAVAPASAARDHLTWINCPDRPAANCWTMRASTASRIRR